MTRQDEALEVLLILRRRLIDRMARVIVENREKLLNGTSRTNNPLLSHADLAEIVRNLSDIDRAISGLAEIAAPLNGEYAVPSVAASETQDEPAEFGIFTRFVELVRRSRLEEAAQELSRMLAMPLDRVTTATRFFSRTLKSDPTVPSQLGKFWLTVGDAGEADATRSLMRLFGFQAVESRMALQALLARVKAAAVSAGR